VNYFEGGQLPKDRAVLYRLCVEGLLHNWDQRRGILSEFGFDEKLRVTRELALEMQVNDRAEYEEHGVREVFTRVLGGEERAVSLLEHIRYRSGLLLERRPAVFAFAHLTFQEYLAARAVYEGNRSGIHIEQLILERADPRWREVIPLYCGVSPAAAARKVIETLADRDEVSGALVGEAYFCSGPQLAQDAELRQKVIWAIANSPDNSAVAVSNAERFSETEFAPVANAVVSGSRTGTTAQAWLLRHARWVDVARLMDRLGKWQQLAFSEVYKLMVLVHLAADDSTLMELARQTELYASPEVDNPTAALIGLFGRPRGDSEATDAVIIQALRAVAASKSASTAFLLLVPVFKERFRAVGAEALQEVLTLLAQLSEQVRVRRDNEETLKALKEWLDSLKPREEPNELQTAVT
jgi:hypothetical protein